MTPAAERGPLSGLRVIEIGDFVAAPFCTRLLGDLGAAVIKIEPPTGDPVRQWGKQLNGHPLWWSVHGRNKRCMTLNLKHPKAASIVLRLVADCDALVENFRPGQLAKLGLNDEALKRARPDLVVAHISGFGQDGPYRDRAAFGVIGEVIGGLRHLCNHPPGTSDLPPVRVGISIGDSLAGLYTAFGIVAALWRRDRDGDRRPRSIDVALTDAVLSMMEGMLPEYSALGLVRQPTGSRIPTAAPSNAYPSADGTWILIAANSDPLFARLAALMGQPELARDPRFTGNRARLQNVDDLDRIIAAWTAVGPQPKSTGSSARPTSRPPGSTPRSNVRRTRSSGSAAWYAKWTILSSVRSSIRAPCHTSRKTRVPFAGPDRRSAHRRMRS